MNAGWVSRRRRLVNSRLSARPYASREPLVQIADHDSRARPVVPQDVALDEPRHLRGALAPPEAEVDVEDVKDLLLESQVHPNAASSLARPHGEVERGHPLERQAREDGVAVRAIRAMNRDSR